MAQDKMQQQRFEQKYLVEEAVARRISDFVRCYLTVDEYGTGCPGDAYPVHNLYLDSDALRLAQDTINGNKNRYKLRLRFYNEDPETPVFFEIKRRVNNCIVKQRVAVRRDAVAGLLAGEPHDPAQLFSPNPKNMASLRRFCDLMEEIHARPKVHVAYLREAYVQPDNNTVRVTLDRQVRAEAELSVRLSTRMESPVLAFDHAVILELKFTDRFPNWFGELVRTFGCQQCGAAKYVEGAELIGMDRLGAPVLAAPTEPAQAEWHRSRATARAALHPAQSHEL